MESNAHIPEGWYEAAFGSLIKEQPKSTINVQDATGYGDYPFFTSGEKVLRHNSYLVDGENILMADGGVANVKFHDGKSAYSNHTYTFTSRGQAITQYLYYFILENLNTINSTLFEGSGLRNLQKKDFKRFVVTLPKSRKEQERIAHILQTIDNVISTTQSLIDKYTNIREGMMDDLLTNGIDSAGHVRTPRTHQYKASPLGPIPEEWEVKSIGEICYVTKLSGFEFTKHMQYIEDGEIIALRAMNVKNDGLVLNDVKYISKNVSDLLKRSKIHAGDVLFTYIGANIGDCVQIQENDRYHLAPNIAKIVSSNHISSSFLEYCLRTKRARNIIKQLITATANPSLTMGQIRTIPLAYPIENTEQKLIEDILNKATLNIFENKLEMNKFLNIKSALLHDLITGKKITVQL